MPYYRFYSISKDGHVSGPPGDIDAPDDQTAVAAAKQLLDGHDVEIWQGPRVVAYLVSNQNSKTG